MTVFEGEVVEQLVADHLARLWNGLSPENTTLAMDALAKADAEEWHGRCRVPEGIFPRPPQVCTDDDGPYLEAWFVVEHLGLIDLVGL